MKQIKRIGLLTAGGDCPGLNAAIRGVGKAVVRRRIEAVGIRDGFLVVELMGHRAGWLTLGAGIAGGADVILIPEIPYSLTQIARAIRQRSQRGTNFSIVAIAEGALSRDYAAHFRAAKARQSRARSQRALKRASAELADLDQQHAGNTLRLSHRLEKLTGLECRVTILGYVQRGGSPSAADRLLATRLGVACAELIQTRVFGVMVAARGTARFQCRSTRSRASEKRCRSITRGLPGPEPSARAWGIDDA